MHVTVCPMLEAVMMTSAAHALQASSTSHHPLDAVVNLT